MKDGGKQISNRRKDGSRRIKQEKLGTKESKKTSRSHGRSGGVLKCCCM